MYTKDIFINAYFIFTISLHWTDVDQSKYSLYCEKKF